MYTKGPWHGRNLGIELRFRHRRSRFLSMAMCVRIVPFLLLLVLASCGSAGLKLFGGYSQLQLTGTAGLDDSGGGGGFTQVDVVDDLGLGSEVGSPYGRAEIDLGLIHLTGSGFLFEETGSGTLSADFAP